MAQSRSLRCPSCGRSSLVSSVVVRLYRRREQLQFHYELCSECSRLLESLLEVDAVGIQRGMFDHKAGVANA